MESFVKNSGSHRIHSLANLVDAIGGQLLASRHGALRPIDLISNSTEVRPGALFVALRGASFDGHEFVNQAFHDGAIAAVVERKDVLGDRPGIVVPDTRAILSKLAARFFNDPSEEVKVCGITGTNGKTSTTWFVRELLDLALGAQAAGSMGTLGTYRGADKLTDAALTTPDPISIQRILADFRDHGIKRAVMEVSSHALHQMRVEGINFRSAVFTNITRDHLDYHGSMEAYIAAKAHLFNLVSKAKGKNNEQEGTIVLGIDNPEVEELWLQHRSQQRCQTFGFKAGTTLQIAEVSEIEGEGQTLTLHFRDRNFEVQWPFVGAHNALNLAAALLAVETLGVPLEVSIPLIPRISQVPGRLERIIGQGKEVYVDYAHTPDALERALLALKPRTKGALKKGDQIKGDPIKVGQIKGDLWVVFGCGGDRDRGKRPVMGEIAARLADKVVITSDNPRTEDPQAIIDEIAAGISKQVYQQVDRKEAIRYALSNSVAGDTILIAGKGHEDYQVIGREKIHFSDQELVREFFSA